MRDPYNHRLRLVQYARHNALQAAARTTMPGRKRTIRDLACHIFQLSLAYRDSFEGGYFPEAWLEETAPRGWADGTAIVEYGQTVRDSLAEWCNRPGAYEGVVNTYYGPQTARKLLERTTWHAAQHLRHSIGSWSRLARLLRTHSMRVTFRGSTCRKKSGDRGISTSSRRLPRFRPAARAMPAPGPPQPCQPGREAQSTACAARQSWGSYSCR